MRQGNKVSQFFFFGCLCCLISACSNEQTKTEQNGSAVGSIFENDTLLAFEINPNDAEMAFYWQNNKRENYGNFSNLREDLNRQNRTLIFAANGGMFNPLYAPQGLYVEKGELLSPIDTFTNRNGNFYLVPNGVFSISKNGVASVVATADYHQHDSVDYATQSGPMLIINGEFHPLFKMDSKHLNIRNGVGILPNGNVLFVISKIEINFYNFAHYFYKRGCKNALYLDGYVSRTYLPQANWNELDGDFGVMIGVSVPN